MGRQKESHMHAGCVFLAAGPHFHNPMVHNKGLGGTAVTMENSTQGKKKKAHTPPEFSAQARVRKK